MATTMAPSNATLSPASQNLNSKPPSLPPLVTTTNTPRRTNSQRPQSFASKRMSSYSNASKWSHHAESRPGSHVFPIFHSSLPYTLVRDFAYPLNHALHYGPPPTLSNLSTPVSEYRRLSDPAASSWDEGRGGWSAVPSWISEEPGETTSREQLPAMTFSDGPPYSEDEDLQSPIVTTSKHKKHKSTSNFERGRSPGNAGPGRGKVVDWSGHARDQASNSNDAGETVARDLSEHYRPQHRDSNFAKPLRRDPQAFRPDQVSEEENSGAEDDSDETRFSKDYSFTIASPDEEMHGKAVALFDFASEHQNELPLREGQIVLVSYRHGQGWLVAEDPRTGESGLVPEEYVRLVREIEGGLNSLEAMDIDDDANDLLSPTSTIEPTSEATPISDNHDFPRNSLAAIANSVERHPPVQSTFSTSSKDLDPYPLPRKSGEHASAVAAEH